LAGSDWVSAAPSCRAALRFASAKSSTPSSAISRAAAAAIRARMCDCLVLFSRAIVPRPAGDHTSPEFADRPLTISARMQID